MPHVKRCLIEPDGEVSGFYKRSDFTSRNDARKESRSDARALHQALGLQRPLLAAFQAEQEAKCENSEHHSDHELAKHCCDSGA